MGRSTDDEILVVRRCAREIEKLEDPRACARVACYLAMRFTRSINHITPAEGTWSADPPIPAFEEPPSGVEDDDETPPAGADGPAIGGHTDPSDGNLGDPSSSAEWDLAGHPDDDESDIPKGDSDESDIPKGDDGEGDIPKGDDEEVSI